MCNVIDLETQDNLQYLFFPASSNAIRFKVKARNDAHVALTRGDFESDPMTEILIGAWRNTKSAIRRDRCRDPDRVKLDTPGILNGDAYVGLWISWSNGCISAGLEGSNDPFISYNDPSPHLIDHVAVKTGWGATGSWKIEVSPVIIPPITPKPFNGKPYWVEMRSGDQVPIDAVIGGFEGEVLYVARASHRLSVCPGKYVPSLKHAVVSWGHQAHIKNQFEILCGHNLMWVKTKSDHLPPHAFPGGTAFETNREILYIGRARIGSNIIPGKIHLHYKACYLPFRNIERCVSHYEVLVVPGNTSHEIAPKLLRDNGMPNILCESEVD